MIVLWAQAALAYNYGAGQITRFAENRQEAGAYLDPGTEYYRFLEKAFAGAYTSVPLLWDPEEPQGNAFAENTPNDDRTFIIIRVSAKLPPLDQVAALTYECMNAQNESTFARYIKEAYMGSLTKEEFIRSILRLEHMKLKETRAFLVPQEPFRDMDISQTEFYRRMVHTPDDFDAFLEYLHRIKRKEYDVFDMYSKFYDFITMTPQKRKEQLEAEAQSAAAEEQKAQAAPVQSPQE
jgi:hypothetical protein